MWYPISGGQGYPPGSPYWSGSEGVPRNPDINLLNVQQQTYGTPAGHMSSIIGHPPTGTGPMAHINQPSWTSPGMQGPSGPIFQSNTMVHTPFMQHPASHSPHYSPVNPQGSSHFNYSHSGGIGGPNLEQAHAIFPHPGNFDYQVNQFGTNIAMSQPIMATNNQPLPPGISSPDDMHPYGFSATYKLTPTISKEDPWRYLQFGSNARLPQESKQIPTQTKECGRQNINRLQTNKQLPDISNEVSRQMDEVISGNKPMSRVIVDVAHAKEASEHLPSTKSSAFTRPKETDQRKPFSPSKQCHQSPNKDYNPSPTGSNHRGPRSRYRSPSSNHCNSPYRPRSDKAQEYRWRRSRSLSPSPYKRRGDSRDRKLNGPRQSRSRWRDEDDYDSDHDSLHLRCFSPPPPNSTRMIKFIMPEEFYNRVKKGMVSDSTVTGTKKLEQLHHKFEEKLLRSVSELETEDEVSIPDLRRRTTASSDEDDNNDDDGLSSDFESLAGSEFSNNSKKSGNGEFLANEFATSDVSEDSETEPGNVGGSALSDSSSDDEDSHCIGQSIEEVRARKIKDPTRLHRELWFNEKGETNDGPVCRCSVKDKQHGIRHAVYPGESGMPSCDPLGNNAHNLHHYWITVTPHANFMTDKPTIIRHDNRDFIFEGFSMFSHQPLDKVPPCSFIRFNLEYSIHCIKQPVPKNFCIKGLDIFSAFLFSRILEIFDWSLKDEDADECQRFHFMPRFVFQRKDQEKGFEVHEMLSMDKVLSYLIDSEKSLVQPSDLKLPVSKRREFSKACRNLIVRRPGKKPAAFRIDEVDFTGDSSDMTSYPLVIHHGIRPVQMSFAGNPKYQTLWKSYVRLRNTLANRPVSSRKDHDKLVKIKIELEKMKLKSSMRRDVIVKLNSRGLTKTGINSDICQHAMVLPVLVHHVRYHMCLGTLDDKLGYTFEDRMLLQLALTHPSYHLNYGMNPDQAKNTLTNCGVKQPRYGDRRIHHIHSRKKGVTHLIRVMANLSKVEENKSMIRHNERLEFLGDAVLEFICSKHLYFMLPDKPEGNLAMFRSALVQNRHLSLLAKKLDLSEYMQFAHGPDLCMEEDLNHAMANCFEALIGAMYLEAGVRVATDLFSRLAFSEEALYRTWMKLPEHPLQTQQPDGDRQLVTSSPLLQKLVEFEEASGISFTHIRLLARAFTHPQVGFNHLTLGDNQRLEFLGDSVLQFVVSVYLYRHFPEHHEGHLTLLRSSLVNSRIQADISRQLELQKYVNFGTKEMKNIREKVLADVLEAFVAALFVDKGLKHVEVFCRVCLFSRLEDNIVNQEWMDAKSQLQQCCLALREDSKIPALPVYKILQNAGPAHHKTFVVGVYYKGRRYGKGEGQSIQQAEMAAAKDALSSHYFPEMERQKHLLDRKHQDKRDRRRSRSPRRYEKRDEKVAEPRWVEEEDWEDVDVSDISNSRSARRKEAHSKTERADHKKRDANHGKHFSKSPRQTEKREDNLKEKKLANTESKQLSKSPGQVKKRDERTDGETQVDDDMERHSKKHRAEEDTSYLG